MDNKYSEKNTLRNNSDELRRLIIFNSDHIWDDVTSQLHKATGYDNIHCEQIAVIAHTKGKAVVKSGELDELEIINSVLKEIDLITSIE
ncbi:MAG: ATP-dependent Clp protease adaptor ClpS [Ignavibacteria bacterium]|jgi:ATP-dependent Clp protease adapter protein ClpS|nr:ATP-dependent Clp protease adaptor ClpS [Ignavibacteria bacterium]